MAKKFAKRLRKLFTLFKPKDQEPKQKLFTRRKMVIVGDGECGKTCLVTRMCTGNFVDVGYVPTVFESEVVTVNTGKEEVDLTIFDTAGQEDYDRLRPFSYLDVDVALVCFNLADIDTLTNVADKWAAEVRSFCGNIPIILVGNKKDLRDSPELAEKKVPNMCETADTECKISTTDLDDCENDNHYVQNNKNEENSPSENTVKDENEIKKEVSSIKSSLTPRPSIPFHVQAPVKHNEGAIIARRIGAVAYIETSALTGDNVEELLLATTKASVLRSHKAKTFKPFLGTLKSWKSVYRLEVLSK